MSRRLWLLAASLLYLLPSSWIAVKRPLWHDEIFTLYLSRLPSMHDVWSALSIGTDLLPPFFYAITRTFVGIFGDSPLVLRLPEILGSWIMALCVFRFTERSMAREAGSEAIDARSTTPAVAGLAMLFPLSTLAALYVYEGRPTAIVGAFAGLALVARQALDTGWRKHEPAADMGRGAALLLLGASLMAAVATHYYALLLVVPFALAELVRAWHRGRIDLAAALAIVAAPLPIVLLRPQVHDGLGYAVAFWSKPYIGTIIEFYQLAFGPAGGVLVALLAIAALVRAVAGARVEAAPAPVPPPHEVAIAVMLASMPIVAVLLALVTVPVFSPRYVLWSVIGASVLFGWTARTVFGNRVWPHVLLALVIAGGLLRGNFRAYNEARSQTSDLAALAIFLDRAAADAAPIVVAQPAEFLELGLSAPPTLSSRLVYLGDPAASIRQTGQDTADRALLSLARFAPIHVEPLSDFTRTHRRFHVYVRDGRGWWLMAELPDRAVTIRARHGSYLLWDVDLDR